MGRSPGVGISLSPGALRESRRKALVVKLHRYGDSPLEALGKRPRPLGLLALLASHGQRKAHQHPLGALILDQPGERGVKAGDVVRAAAQVAGGGGGGRDPMAQAGGREPEKLPEALATARAEIEKALA